MHWGTGQYAGKKWDGKSWVQATPEERATHAESVSAHGVVRITTLPTLPGFRITESVGIVSVIRAASGWTAGTKGNDALTKAHRELMEQATALGANAVVGVSGSAFGAAGGITNVLGGDAVGILLMGTAVRAVPDDSSNTGGIIAQQGRVPLDSDFDEDGAVASGSS
jgi:uncharacterized protein YbjQ (UPF0145 family)